MDKALLANFLDSNDRLKQWPSKRSMQTLALAYLVEKFEEGRFYTEKEVNEKLEEWHTFNDWALLRRELFDKGYFDRELNGSNYKRKQANI